MANGIFVGLSTIDVVYNVDEFPSANSKIVAHSQEVYAGGPATNASIAFTQLGGKSTLVTAVGRHSAAGVIKQELQQYSVLLIDLNPDFEQAPVISSVTVNRAGERNVVSANATRVNAKPAHVDEAFLDRASVVLVDGHYVQACQVWSKAARSRGIHVVLDGGSWKAGTDELLKTIDTAICSADFMPPGCFSEDDMLKFLVDRGVKNIAITKGAKPIRFISDGSSGIVPVPQVRLVDTMGAGDILHGAFCYFASNRSVFEEALRSAARVASESCRFHGTREWMKHYERTAQDASAPSESGR